jgi:predicted Rossmann-fold nucleotide-binding protein
MKILVCGGRDYKDAGAVSHALDTLHAKKHITLIIEGGAPGADRLAREWAEANGVPVQTFEAEWERYGRRAGPLRNKRMLDEGRPDGVVASPGGTGTADMVKQAEAGGLKVWRPFG